MASIGDKTLSLTQLEALVLMGRILVFIRPLRAYPEYGLDIDEAAHPFVVVGADFKDPNVPSLSVLMINSFKNKSPQDGRVFAARHAEQYVPIAPNPRGDSQPPQVDLHQKREMPRLSWVNTKRSFVVNMRHFNDNQQDVFANLRLSYPSVKQLRAVVTVAADFGNLADVAKQLQSTRLAPFHGPLTRDDSQLLPRLRDFVVWIEAKGHRPDTTSPLSP